MTIKAWPDLPTGTGEVAKNLTFFGARWENYLGATVLVFFFRHARCAVSYKTWIWFFLMPFRMPPIPFSMPPLFITAVKDICAINTFEKLLNILFSEVSCWHFGFTTPFSPFFTIDMSLYEVLTLFPHWPFVFRSFLLPPLVARDVITPNAEW